MSKIILEDSTMASIADAIRSKNGETKQYLPAEMPAKIEAIETGGGDFVINNDFNLLQNKSTLKLKEAVEKGEFINGDFMLYGASSYDFSSIENIPIKFLSIHAAFSLSSSNNGKLQSNNWDMSNCISMESAFRNSYMTSINLSNWNTKNVRNFSSFLNTSRTTEIIGLENLDTSNAIDISNMFYNSYYDKNIVLNWNVENVMSISGIFNGIKSETIDIGKLDFKSLVNNPTFNFNQNKIRNIVLPNLPVLQSGNFYVTSSPNSSNYDIHCTFGEGNTWGNEVNGISSTLSLVYLWQKSDFVDNYVEFAESIAPNTSGWSRNIRIYTTLYNALSDEQKAILTDKGYTLKYATS